MKKIFNVFLVSLVLFVSCKTNKGDDYVGVWKDSKGGSKEVTITKNENSYLVKTNFGSAKGMQLPATYNSETGLFNVSFSGLTFPISIEKSTGLLSIESDSFKKNE